VTLKLSVEFWNVYGSSMVKDCIQAFQYTLLGEVHLIDQEPVAFLDRPEEGAIAPPELNIFTITRLWATVVVGCGILATKKVHHVRLLTQVDSGEQPATYSGQVFDEAGFSNSRRSFYQGWLLQLMSSQQPMEI
jgi:hypothetical protein